MMIMSLSRNLIIRCSQLLGWYVRIVFLFQVYINVSVVTVGCSHDYIKEDAHDSMVYSY